MALPNKEEVAALLKEAQGYACVSSMPTKKFFVLEDDIHSAEGYAYLGSEADTVAVLLCKLAEVYDWTYVIYRLSNMSVCAYGTVYVCD